MSFGIGVDPRWWLDWDKEDYSRSPVEVSGDKG